MKPAVVDVSGAGAPEVVCAPPGSLQMSPGVIHRHFIAVPAGAAWAEVTVTMDSYTGLGGDRRVLYMHALQLVPHVPFSLTEHKPTWYANQGDKKVHKFKVWGGRTLELTLAQLQASDLDVESMTGLFSRAQSYAARCETLLMQVEQEVALWDSDNPEQAPQPYRPA